MIKNVSINVYLKLDVYCKAERFLKRDIGKTKTDTIERTTILSVQNPFLPAIYCSNGSIYEKDFMKSGFQTYESLPLHFSELLHIPITPYNII